MAPARVPLGVDLDPLDLLRALRGRDRLVALLGPGWASGPIVAWGPDRVLDDDGDPFGVLDEAEAGPSDGAFAGGWIGYWGYQLLHRLERVPAGAPTDDGPPAYTLAHYDRALRLVDGTWWAEGEVGAATLDAWAADVRRVVTAGPRAAPPPPVLTPFEPERDPADHRTAIGRALRHVHDGDIFQVNLCTALRAGFDGDPLDLLLAAWARVAPRFAAYVSWPGGAVVSLSPELFLRREGDRVLTSPIKGTAPRDPDQARDAAAAEHLLGSAKDRAENVMIVDLMRNDLARVCRPATVRASPLRVEEHAVWHLVADVEGRLEPGTTDGDLLRATFPPGSVTGAPKVRAMEVVAELEDSPRHVYTGAVGLAARGRLELNVAIRTFEVDLARHRVRLGVGGGIVADSDPGREWQECLTKAAPLVAAVGGSIRAPASTAPPVAADPVALPRPVGASPAPPPGRPLLTPPRVLFIDNYDSFVHNLVDYARQHGATTRVVRNDEVSVDDLVAMRASGELTHLVVSPGPGGPLEAGVSVEAIRRLAPTTPVLGVCLGHQAVVCAYGGRVVHAPEVVHGKASPVHHDGAGLWAGLTGPVQLGRYHSLVADPASLPEVLEVTARTAEGVVMAVRHRHLPVVGVQGHPESVLTPHGLHLVGTFLAGGLATADPALGVFDTLLVLDGRPVALGAHLDRFLADVADVYGVTLDRSDLADRVRAAARRAGPARLRTSYDPAATAVSMAVHPVPHREDAPWCLVPQRVPGGLGGHKWSDRRVLDQLATVAWDAVTDPLLLDADDRVLETGRGNVFVVRDGVVTTPALDGRLLPGVVRAEVLAVLRELGVEAREASLPLDELAAADEVFATGSIGGVRPVMSVDRVGAWRPGPLTARVREAVERRWARGLVE